EFSVVAPKAGHLHLAHPFQRLADPDVGLLSRAGIGEAGAGDQGRVSAPKLGEGKLDGSGLPMWTNPRLVDAAAPLRDRLWPTGVRLVERERQVVDESPEGELLAHEHRLMLTPLLTPPLGAEVFRTKKSPVTRGFLEWAVKGSNLRP